MENLIKFYKQILSAASLSVTSDNCVSVLVGGELKPMTIAGQRLVLPTPEHLANPDWDHRVAFHPLSENILVGESKVLERYRTAVMTQINVVVSFVISELLTLATSPAMHKKLSPDQSEFLSLLKMADEKTIEMFEKVLNNIEGGKLGSTFIHVYQKRGGVINGKKFTRTAIVSFPFWEALEKADKELMGVKMRVKDREALRNVIKYIFTEIETPTAYAAGSDSKIAPYLESLLAVVRNVACPTNDICDLFKNVFSEDKTIPADWVATLEDMSVLVNEIRMIPSLKGNEGPAAKAATPTAQPAPAVQEKPAIPAADPRANLPLPGHAPAPLPLPVAAVPYKAPTAPAPATNGKPEAISMDELARRCAANNVHLPMMAPMQPMGYAVPAAPQRASLSNPVTAFNGYGMNNQFGGGYGMGGGVGIGGNYPMGGYNNNMAPGWQRI